MTLNTTKYVNELTEIITTIKDQEKQATKLKKELYEKLKESFSQIYLKVSELKNIPNIQMTTQIVIELHNEKIKPFASHDSDMIYDGDASIEYKLFDSLTEQSIKIQLKPNNPLKSEKNIALIMDSSDDENVSFILMNAEKHNNGSRYNRVLIDDIRLINHILFETNAMNDILDSFIESIKNKI